MKQGTGTALVTGASRGLGLETCRQLGRLGWRVWLTAPDPDEGQRASEVLRSEGLDVHFEPLDVASQESLSTLAGRLEQQGVRLSALVNNAGVALEGFDAHVAEHTVAVNFLGPLRVTERLLPLMEEHGRIVMVGSNLAELKDYPPSFQRRFDPPPPKEQLRALLGAFVEDVRAGVYEDKGWPRSAYRVSKLGLNALTRLLAEELKPRHLIVNAVCPGWVRTQMGGQHAARSVERGADILVWAATLPPGGPTGGCFCNRKPIPW
ncbi:SDR family oxidoreductase [Archangium gephyra]|uniref:SDR family oxidoreductase n=1 Tax=Archangium gephyra TaxID=48 RepID=UPI0035D4FF62